MERPFAALIREIWIRLMLQQEFKKVQVAPDALERKQWDVNAGAPRVGVSAVLQKQFCSSDIARFTRQFQRSDRAARRVVVFTCRTAIGLGAAATAAVARSFDSGLRRVPEDHGRKPRRPPPRPSGAASDRLSTPAWGSAPSVNRASAVSRLPVFAAVSRGVSPELLVAFISALALIRSFKAARSPAPAARWREWRRPNLSR